MAKKTCNWIYSKPGEPVVKCQEPVGSYRKPDDDGVPRREYFAFCPQHLVAAAAQEAAEE